MITLYHGSNVAIDAIDLSKGMKDKDFGTRTYLQETKSPVFLWDREGNF